MVSFPNSSKLKAGWDLIFSSTALESGCLCLNPKFTILCPEVLDNLLDGSGLQFPKLQKKKML